MKFPFHLLCLIVLIFSNKIAKAQTWQHITDFPSVERDDGVSFVINNKAYCGTGLKTGWSATGDFYSFDMQSELWEPAASLPAGTERQYASAFAYNNYGYIVGGVASNTLSDVWQYNPSSNNWVQKTSKPGIGVYGSVSFVIDGNAYLIGGNSVNGYSNEVWMYSINSDNWIQKNNFPGGGIWRASAIAVNGKGYLIFGKYVSNFNSSLFEYNPLSDEWRILSSFPLQAKNYASMLSFGNGFVVFGGIDSANTYYNDMWLFSLRDFKWHQLESLPSFGRKGGMSFGNSKQFYYSTGINQMDLRLKETWKFNFPAEITDDSNEFLIYPNPSSEFVFIQNVDEENFEIELLSVLGKRYFKTQSAKYLQTIDLRSIKDGIYLLKIKSPNKEQFRKLVIAH
jgi:N-acetylneuraminic acid mutarotase